MTRNPNVSRIDERKQPVNAASENYGRYYYKESQRNIENKQKFDKIILDKIQNNDYDFRHAKLKIIKSNMEGEKEFVITPEGNSL